MSQPAADIPICRSVFRNGAAATTTEKYTQIWITLINRAEQNKRVLAELE